MEYVLTELPWQEPIESKLNRSVQMSNQLTVSPHSFAEVMEFAKTVSESKVLGLVTPAQVAVIMLLAQAEGIHPIQAIRDYHIIQNRPAMKSTTLLRRFQKAGGSVQWGERTNEKVEAKFIHPTGTAAVVTWTIENAKQAGLSLKENWVKYPRQMLTARVISEGVQLVYPEALGGLITVEEAQDLPIDTNCIEGSLIENTELRTELLEEQKTKDELKKLDEEFHAKAASLYGQINKGEMSKEIGVNEWNNLIAGMLAKGLPKIPDEIMEAFKKLLADEINKPYQTYQPILGDAA